MYAESNRRYNYGYKFLEAVYNMFEIDRFVEGHLKEAGFRGEYPLAGIFKFLVCRASY
jgi:hypothetical protein